jgi:hypothetical protein
MNFLIKLTGVNCMNATQRNKVGSKLLLSATLSALLFCTATAFAGVDGAKEANKECGSINAGPHRDMCFYKEGFLAAIRKEAAMNPFSARSEPKIHCTDPNNVSSCTYVGPRDEKKTDPVTRDIP